MYLAVKGSPMTVKWSDGESRTGTFDTDIPFKREHVVARPPKSHQHNDYFVFSWAGVEVVVHGRYVIDQSHEPDDPRTFTDPGIVGPRPRRHYFQPMRRAS